MGSVAKFLFLFLSLMSLTSLEVTRGRIRLNYDRQRGSVIISTTESLENPRWIPLTWSRDPTTTMMSIRLNGQVLNLQPGGQFRLEASEESNGLLLTYQGTKTDVLVRYEFLTTRYSSIVDGLRLTVEITNKDSRDARVDFRYLIDTYLGEQGNHFLVDNLEINKEFRIIGRSSQSWVSARGDNPPQVGILFWLGDGVTPPTRTIFANWKRLRDSTWDIPFSEGRDFSLAPYSFNDSAVAVYYEGMIIQPESKQTLVLALSNVTAKDLIGARIGTESALADSFESTVEAPSNVNNLLQLLRRDRETVLDLIRKVNIKMNNPDSVTSDEIAAMRAILRELEGRKKIFE